MCFALYCIVLYNIAKHGVRCSIAMLCYVALHCIFLSCMSCAVLYRVVSLSAIIAGFVSQILQSSRTNNFIIGRVFMKTDSLGW